MIRIAAAICVVIFGALFAWVAFSTFTAPERIVVPTGGVIGSATKDDLPTGPAAKDALAARAELQRWRSASGPSPEGALSSPEQTVTGQAMPSGNQDQGADGAALTRQWVEERDRDWSILADNGFQEGTASLPSERARVLEQPQGRDFRRRHEDTISYTGGWIIFGTTLLLSLFLLLRGRVPVAKGFSGEKVPRFDAMERTNHWMTASSFTMMALTGLVLIYGWRFFEPILGPEGYNVLAQWSLYLHIAFAGPFLVGLCLMAALWVRENVVTAVDIQWLRQLGGMLSDSADNPHAYKINAGQKLLFWAVVLGGLLMTASGLILMFPFYFTDIGVLQWILLGHALLALLLVALIIAHAYIGTVGMEGAFEAMWDGTVDFNWAEEHHDLWVEELERKGGREARPGSVGRAVPAE